METRVIVVWSEDDYGAAYFEEAVRDTLRPNYDFDTDLSERLEMLWENMAKHGSLGEVSENSILDTDFLAIGLKFGQVDPKFIDFVRSEIQDYDQSKSTQFYVSQENGKWTTKS